MAREIDFTDGVTVVPAAWLDNMQEVLSGLHFGVRLDKASATQVQLTPLDDGNDLVTGQSSIMVNGHPRWWQSAIVKTVSGPAGTYGIYVTAGESTTLGTANVTLTTGAAPANSRYIGSVVWSGTAITAIKQDGAASTTGAMIEEGALSNSGDITWTRDTNGAWIPQLKEKIIGSTDLADLAVTTAKLAEQAVTAIKLGTNSVTEAKIEALAVATAKLAAKAVTEAKLGDESVNTLQLKNLAVTVAKLGEEAVETLKIKNLAVTTAKLGELAVSTIKIAELAVTEAKIADGAVSSRKWKPVSGLLTATANLTTTASFVLVPGMKLELSAAQCAVASALYLEYDYYKGNVGRSNNTIFVDGAEVAFTSIFSTQEEAHHHASWRIPLTAGAHTIEIRAKQSIGSSFIAAEAEKLTRASYFLLST